MLNVLLVAPFLGPPVLQPEDAGGRIRRVMLGDFGLDDVALAHGNMDVWVAVALGPLIKRLDDFGVSLLSSGLYGAKKFRYSGNPVVDGGCGDVKRRGELLVGGAKQT